MALTPYIDETGIHTPEYQDILDGIKAEWKAIFGDDLYLEADSQEGEMLQIFALAKYDAGQALAAAYQGFSPQTAQGAGLSRMVKVNGIRRRSATRSQVDVRIVGVAGTVITGGVVEDDAGRKWNLPASITIPYEGEVTATAMAQDYGAVRVQPGEINKIATPTRGWQTIENVNPAATGTAAESDAELRLRQTYSTSLPSLSIMEGIVGAVASIKDVTRIRGYENDTNAPDENGIPPHSIALVVEGGDPQEIAKAIHTKKTPGTGTYGYTAVPVADQYGFRSYIKFFRPVLIAVKISIYLKVRQGYSEDIFNRIKNNLTEYVNALGIGNPVLLSKLYAPIDSADTNTSSGIHFEVTQLLMSRGEGPFLAANILIAFNEMAVPDVDGINIITTV